MDRIKSKFRRFSNRPALIYESKIREWDGTILSKARVASSDTKNLARAFKDNADLLSLNINIPSMNNDDHIKKEVNEVKELMRKKKEEDLKRIKDFMNKNK